MQIRNLGGRRPTTSPRRTTTTAASAGTSERTTARPTTLATTALHPASRLELTLRTRTRLLSALLDVQPISTEHDGVCGDGGAEAGGGGEFYEGAVLFANSQ